jgi:hypothetical protein
MSKLILKSILFIIGLPIVLNSYNIKILYQINKIKEEIKNIEIENDYKRKKLYNNSTMQKIIRNAQNLGFTTPEPHTIVMLDKQNINNTRAKTDLLAKKTTSKNFKVEGNI